MSEAEPRRSRRRSGAAVASAAASAASTAALAAAASTTASLTEDAYSHIMSLCGIQTIQLRLVSQLFGRLWSDPATWAGCITAWLRSPPPPPAGAARDIPSRERDCMFLRQRILPALARAEGLDTNAFALQLCGSMSLNIGASILSQARFGIMPAVNSNRPPARGWFRPAGGFQGVSGNVAVEGAMARRVRPEIAGMAAVCADGPVSRTASGERAYTLRVEGVSALVGAEGGIYVGFAATPPGEIDFSDAPAMWRTACMWRLINDKLNANVICQDANDTLNRNLSQPPGAIPWTTSQLQLGDELRIIAQCGAATSLSDGGMSLSATLNGEPVMLPTPMLCCSFAMELWPYVAVCGRVTAVRLVL